jgi:hypothetical protein
VDCTPVRDPEAVFREHRNELSGSKEEKFLSTVWLVHGNLHVSLMEFSRHVLALFACSALHYVPLLVYNQTNVVSVFYR